MDAGHLTLAQHALGPPSFEQPQPHVFCGFGCFGSRLQVSSRLLSNFILPILFECYEGKDSERHKDSDKRNTGETDQSKSDVKAPVTISLLLPNRRKRIAHSNCTTGVRQSSIEPRNASFGRIQSNGPRVSGRLRHRRKALPIYSYYIECDALCACIRAAAFCSASFC